ncbi:MAG: DUF721 domain-containing protein [Chthonomonas sp.]|nr:DUF721 domain-containing protein [Chthonomonas sp.]
MKKLGDVLPRAFDRPEILRAGRAQRVIRQWATIVGDTIGQHSVPDRYEHGTLWIAASGNAWAQEIRLMKTEVLKRLNEAAGETLFEQIRVGTRPPRRNWIDGESDLD